MRVGNYTLLVTRGIERRAGRVNVPRGEKFEIKILSHDNRPCDIVVTVDGTCVLKSKLPANGNIVVSGWDEEASEPFISGDFEGDIVVKCKRPNGNMELVELVLSVNPVDAEKIGGKKRDKNG